MALKFKNEQEATIAMFSGAQDWPNLALPVKNRQRRDSTGFPALGFLSEPVGRNGLTIHIGCMFLGAHEKEEHYESVEAAMAAGWVVD